jgi:hypothetical protein
LLERPTDRLIYLILYEYTYVHFVRIYIERFEMRLVLGLSKVNGASRINKYVQLLALTVYCANHLYGSQMSVYNPTLPSQEESLQNPIDSQVYMKQTQKESGIDISNKTPATNETTTLLQTDIITSQIERPFHNNLNFGSSE